MTMRPFFLESDGARLFALECLPQGRPRGAVLYVPPFAEEMNRCRAIVAEQARAFAHLGYASLCIDLFGTGESEGEFEDARWDIWERNVSDAASWLADKTGQAVTLWGFRLGALLAASVAAKAPGRYPQLLLWQPVADGKPFVTQTLRQRVAWLMGQGLPAESTDDIRAALAGGAVVEVAGYSLSGPLVEGISAQKLGALSGLEGVRIDWFEHVADAGAELSIACRRNLDALEKLGAQVTAHPFVGAPLWQLHKRDEAPDLVAQTTARYAPAATPPA
ncbi:hydrolase 2, exosortase A system-associated [Denitromonas iodatirespirans]|uniref:Hydrolase 2, exosortase A system-associated n=1 Tax=Denitromonas iodatirespirans TaxID=2795389 RepID=A0A944D675_DENI1|nr:hydrolase 2, exosortase A system-associated [Denitromonas iodatirespirans]MBT0960590.1 hydrolase 2, exosortase A system-associated [Denitromonas iodatirespirans]